MTVPAALPRVLRVFIVEDDAAMRAVFERMVTAHEGLTLAGSAGSIAEGRQALAAAGCDVAVIDLGLPDGDGSDLIAWLRQARAGIAVLVSTMFGDEAHVVRAIEAGAQGYLLKDSTGDDFARSILAVAEGGSPLSPQIARHLLKRFTSPPAAGTPRRMRKTNTVHEPLTPREVDILQAIAQGYSAAETAQRLSLSPHTVTSYIKTIYGKLSVHNRVEAVNTARDQGLL
jgi:DNA-binding NarL/FixJ family response regulator